MCATPLTHLHSERPKLYGVLAVLSAVGLRMFRIKVTDICNTSFSTSSVQYLYRYLKKKKMHYGEVP